MLKYLHKDAAEHPYVAICTAALIRQVLFGAGLRNTLGLAYCDLPGHYTSAMNICDVFSYTPQ